MTLFDRQKHLQTQILYWSIDPLFIINKPNQPSMYGLSNKEKQQYAEIMFSLSQRQKRQELQGMSDRERQKFKQVVAQKVIYQCTKKYIPPPKEKQQEFTFSPTKPGFLSTVLCCCYPEDNRHNFDVTTKIFLRRFFGVFLICKTNFLKFGIPKVRRGKGKRLKDDPFDKSGIMANYNQNEVDIDGRNNTPDLYGPMWITGTYMIMLMICANLNDYFISGNDEYIFNTEYCSPIIGIVFLFTLAQSLVYKSAIGCLKGNMTSSESICLIGYSQILYFIPTIFCVIPSMYVHILALVAGGLLKAIFLYRNYGKFIESKRETLLGLFLFIELLYFYTIMRNVFYNYKSYSISQGTTAVLGHHQQFFNLRRHFD